MHRHVVSLCLALFTVVVLDGCVARVRFVADTAPTQLVEVSSGVWVVYDYPEAVFYADDAYWWWYQGAWYKSRYADSGWVVVATAEVPSVIVAIDHPDRYVRYHGHGARRDVPEAHVGGRYDRGRSADAPGHDPDGPGRSEDAPGHADDRDRDHDRGRSDDAPGHDPDGPGRSEDAPGHADDRDRGRSEDAPGHDPDGPGRSEDAPGHADEHGRSDPGPATTPPGHDDDDDDDDHGRSEDHGHDDEHRHDDDHGHDDHGGGGGGGRGRGPGH